MDGSKQQFFNVLPVAAALEKLFTHIGTVPLRTSRIMTVNALDRVLAEAPISPIDLPAFARSSMDGYAVRAADTFGASQSLPAYLKCIGRVEMGQAPTEALTTGTALEITTGAMMPPGADAVVMIERTQAIGNGEIEVLNPVAPGENVIQIGEDVAQGAPILQRGHRLRPQDIGGLLAVGILDVEVIEPVRVAILSSGDELVAPDSTPAPGQIRDINAYTLAALCKAHGAEPIIMGIAHDSLEDLLDLAEAGLDQGDLLVLTAGSSVSTRDLTTEAIRRLGQPGILQYGLAVKPGKPTIIAACNGKAVIGLPGNPVSAFLVARQVVLPIIHRMFGEAPRYIGHIQAQLTANIASASGREDLIPVKLTQRDGRVFAEPNFGKSNLIFTLIAADGLVSVPMDSNGMKAGSTVEVMVF